MKGRQIRYSATELAWVEACADLTRIELHALFVQIFNRPEITVENLKTLCSRKGWKTGRTGQFHKGQVSHNAGKKGYCAPGSEKGWFRKGHLPHNTNYLGHERLTKDGYIEISVAETNPHTGFERRYVQKHKHMWEQQNGPVPEGHRLKCLDGNKTNTDPANWEALPMALAPRLNGRFGRNYDAAPAELKPLIMAATKLEHRARSLKKEGQNHG